MGRGRGWELQPAEGRPQRSPGGIHERERRGHEHWIGAQPPGCDILQLRDSGQICFPLWKVFPRYARAPGPPGRFLRRGAGDGP